MSAIRLDGSPAAILAATVLLPEPVPPAMPTTSGFGLVMGDGYSTGGRLDEHFVDFQALASITETQ